jgi:hypothetical protein
VLFGARLAIFTLMIDWHVNVLNCSISAKDFSQMFLVDILGELLYNNLFVILAEYIQCIEKMDILLRFVVEE